VRVPISNGDFGLLLAFLTRPNRNLSRDQLLELSRLRSSEVYDRSIDVQILRLRRKIESHPARPELIKTERGLCCRFCVPVATVHSAVKQDSGARRPLLLAGLTHVRNASSYAGDRGDPLSGTI